MRKWLDVYLSELAKTDSKVRLLIADVGNFPCFSKEHPDKFINVGVSESNCIGIAAGLSYEGLRVFVYGVSSFFLYRAYEQLKYSVSYWKRNVTFIGVGFGWKYFNIGAGHFCPDDISLVRALPFFQIETPYKLSQLNSIIKKEVRSPQYIRLTANILPEETEIDFMPTNTVVVTYGEMVKTCVLLTKRVFAETGRRIGLYALDNLNDETITTILPQLKGKKVIVIEDHIIQGGLSALLCEKNVAVTRSINLPTCPDKIASSRIELLKSYGFDETALFNQLNLVQTNVREL